MEKRTKELDVWLSEVIKSLRAHGKQLISNISLTIRKMGMWDLRDKCEGDVVAHNEAPQTDVPSTIESRKCKYSLLHLTNIYSNS